MVYYLHLPQQSKYVRCLMLDDRVKGKYLKFDFCIPPINLVSQQYQIYA